MGTAVTVGVINYNGASYLARTLDAVRRLGSEVDEIMVVDNGSTDESIRVIREHPAGARVIELGGNAGPGAARNVALREAGNDRVLLLDNDVAPESRCASLLGEALDACPGAVLAMPAVLYAADPLTVQYVGATAHFMGTMTLNCADRPVAELTAGIRPAGSLVAAALLVDRRRLDGRILFDETLFLYLEDHEAGLRCRLLALDLVVHPAARCLHAEGAIGISIRQTGQFTPIRVRHTIRNRWQIMLKLYQWRTLLRFSPALAVFECLQFLGAIRKGWLRHWLWAIGSMTVDLPAMLRRRRDFQRQRRRPDLAVLEGGAFPFNRSMHQSSIERAAQRALGVVVQWNWRIAGRRR